MMSNVNFLAPGLFLFWLLAVMPTVVAEQDEPSAIILTMVEQVRENLNTRRAELQANPDRLYGLIDEFINPHFDFVITSKWILGKQWKTASEEQRAVFVEQFRTLLMRSYAKSLLGVTEETVNHLETRQSSRPNIVQVVTEIVSVSGDQSVPVNYTMRDGGAGWKVINVSFEGVSLVETYRQSFASEIRNNGLDALLQKLTEKNEKSEPARAD